MAAKKKKENKASSNNDDAFFVYEEDNKEHISNIQDKAASNSTKNTIYVYKDKTTTTVCYDAKNPHYNIVHME